MDMQNHMIVIAHHGISGNINSKDTGQFKQSIYNPLPAMFETLTGMRIFTAQKGAANATGNTMIIGGGIK
jgi:hypothetical protein